MTHYPNFGVMFFGDNDTAFGNLRSAIKTGGRMAATVWATPQENPWFSSTRSVVDELVKDVPRPDPTGPGPMRFGDPSTLQIILERTGWTPDIQTVELELTPPGTSERLADLLMKVNVGSMLRGCLLYTSPSPRDS